MTIDITASHGIAIKLGNGASSEVFTEIEGVFNGPNGPDASPNIIEARHHSSDSTIRKAAYLNPATVSFSIYYDSSNVQHAALLTAARALTKKNFQQLLTDDGAEQYAYGAFIGMTFRGDVDGFNVYDVTLSIDGDIAVS